MKNTKDIPQKIKNRITIWSSSSMSGYLPRKKKKERKLIQKDTSSQYSQQHYLHWSRCEENKKYPDNKWMDK